MAAKFEIFKDRAAKYRFRLKAANGEIVLASQGYASKSSTVNGIESVKKNCTNGDCFERMKTSSGKYRFNLKARNHQVIGTSESYDTEAACSNGIVAVGRAATRAPTEDLTR